MQGSTSGFQRDEHLALSPLIANSGSSGTAFKPFASSNVVVIYGFPWNRGSGLVIRMDIFFITMYWTVISAQNGVDCILFHIFSKFLVGMPKFWVEIIKTACTASRLVQIFFKYSTLVYFHSTKVLDSVRQSQKK